MPYFCFPVAQKQRNINVKKVFYIYIYTDFIPFTGNRGSVTPQILENLLIQCLASKAC